ncbi:hypothetical protein KA478_04125 [Patescibacteria group bacterium]|nr:hypothetical protein [Patescibacteria group bacterium]
MNIVAASQSPNISQVGKYVFRYANGITAAERIGELADSHFTKFILVSEKTEFAQSIATVVRELAGDKIRSEVQYESSEKDFSIIAKQVRKNLGEVDAIVVLPQSEASVTNVIRAFNKE